MKVKELPTFHNGMCYVIELMDRYISKDSLTVTVKRNKGNEMEYVKWTMTSDHDYLSETHLNMWIDYMPFKFTSLFGDMMNHKVKTVQTIRKPLKCTMYNDDYISEQQCLVNDYFAKDFSPCPVKCIPVQMRGFRYINGSSNLQNCKRLDDEICNGGPIVWKELENSFEKCIKPCRMSSYDQSLIEKKEMTYINVDEDEASFQFVNSDVSPVEKEVLLYDLSDVIGTIGGSLGVAVGISVFAIVSCCIDNFFELANIFQTKKVFE